MKTSIDNTLAKSKKAVTKPDIMRQGLFIETGEDNFFINSDWLMMERI